MLRCQQRLQREPVELVARVTAGRCDEPAARRRAAHRPRRAHARADRGGIPIGRNGASLRSPVDDERDLTLGHVEGRAATAAEVPRMTSSNRFVSSRQTATRRPGGPQPGCAAMTAAAAATRSRRPDGGQPRAPPRAHRSALAAADSRENGTARLRARSRREPSRPPTARAARSPARRARAPPRSACPGIVDAGQTRIGDERHPLARGESRQSSRTPAASLCS